MNSRTRNFVCKRRTVWIWAALYVTVLFSMYYSTLAYLLQEWRSDEFTYCCIVPFVVLYLIWEKRGRLAYLPSTPTWKGLIPMGFGVCLFAMGELGAEYTLLFVSLWLFAVGLCWLHLGWQKLRTISFPLFFSLAMFVPPGVVYAPASFELKIISSKFGVWLMQSYGLSAYREGNVIDLGFTKLQVVDACSGLRFLIPLFLMALLLAYYFCAPFWKKMVLVCSAIPLSIFTNSLRIASVGILYQFFGIMAAEGFLHEFSGWFIFILSLAFLTLEMRLLKRSSKDNKKLMFCHDELAVGRGAEFGKEQSGVRCGEEDGHASLPRRIIAVVQPPQAPAAMALLCMILILSQGAVYGEKMVQINPFSGFPLQIGEWSGIRTDMEQQFLDTLKLTDYALLEYRNGDEEIGLYVAYNGSQSKGKATHSPATCLPGNGWDFRESGPASIPLRGNSGATLRVNRAFMEKNGVKQLVYYWFPQRGRILTNLYQVKLYNFWDALTRRRTDGSLVRLITPLHVTEHPKDAEARLQGFTRLIVPLVAEYLPQ